MNVFIIPSWYPSFENDTNGIFIRDQIDAISELHPNICLNVSTWGHLSGHLSFRSPMRTLNSICWRFQNNFDRYIRHNNGVIEFFSPSLSWDSRIPFGGASCLLGPNEKNLLSSIRMHGSIDLIHAHAGYPAGVIALWLSKKYNIPFILTEHMGPFPFPSLLRFGKLIPELKASYENANKVLAVSPFLANEIRKFTLVDPIVVPNLVNELVFYEGHYKAQKFVFLTLCSMTKGKGIEDLLHAIALWRPSKIPVEFWIAGDGPMMQTYKLLAKRLLISDRICWIGGVGRKEAAKLYRQCNAFILPSLYETFGVVYAEAIASGIPIIATRCGGPESIVNEANGILVDVNNPAALSEAIQRMISNIIFYSSEVIREDFIKRFSRKPVAEKISKIYTSAIY